jgi:hypothetical protein
MFARVLDAKHLELSQQLEASPGDVIQILISSEPEDEFGEWCNTAKQHFLDAYADEDAIYDEL